MPKTFSPTSFLYVLVAAIYVLVFPYHPKLRSPNELCRLWQSRALVEYGTIELNQALRDFGYVGDLSVKDGRYFPSKAPLLSFAAAPLYWGLKKFAGPDLHSVPEIPQVFFSRLLLTVLPTLVMLVYLRKFLLHYVSDSVADLVVMTYALGSLAFSYSLAFIGHQTTAVLIFFAFYHLWKSHLDIAPQRRFLWAGMFAGAAVANEYTAALPIVFLALYEVLFQFRKPLSLRRKMLGLAQHSLVALAGALPFLLFLMAYHQAAFGHPLESGYKHLNDAGYQGWHVGGFLGIRFPDVHALLASFFSPLRGFVTTSPFLLLAAPGLFTFWKRTQSDVAPLEKELFVLTVLLLLGYSYFTSSFSYESWGWTTGPRHLTPLVPFLLLPIALALENALQHASSRMNQFWGTVGVALCAFSILEFGTVVMVNYIPDSLSTAFFGAALPLLKDGYFAPSVLLFLGIPNPLSGAIVWVLLLLAAAGVFALGTKLFSCPKTLSVAGLLVTMSLVFTPLYLATKHHEADVAAVNHLKATWLAPPHVKVVFWNEAPTP